MMPPIRTTRYDPDRLRFEGRWVFDGSSARGGIYVGDDAGDMLAADAKAAIAALLERRSGLAYRTGEPVVAALAGGGRERKRAPSIVWHAQAIGVLLELGYMPSAECVAPHLEVLERRLDPRNADPPSADAEDVTWTLRTRHVAWVLACLAELHAQTMPSSELPVDVLEAIKHYRRVAETAFRYLVGASEACRWIGLQDGEPFWSEHWQIRRINLLNTIYASLAICRACRHGFAMPLHSGWDGSFPVEHTIHRFVDLIRIEPGAGGPRTFIGGDWEEPWAKHPLPAGVVGLLGLLLNEYAHLLLGLASPGSPLESRARKAHALALRTAHDLVSRHESWAATVDAFSYQGAERRLWFVPTYSVALRSVLESGAAPPNHEAVVEALRTISSFARVSATRSGEEYETWGDPTRADLAARVPADATDATWHTTISLTEIDPSDCVPTASSVHASVMALAAFRRAAHAADPRLLAAAIESSSGIEEDEPASPFTSVVVSYAGPDGRGGRPRDFLLVLSIGDEYREHHRVGAGEAAVLLACQRADAPESDAAIGDRVKAIGPEKASLPRAPRSVRSAIASLNEKLGVALVQRDGSPVCSSIGARILVDEESLPPNWRQSLGTVEKRP